MPYKLFDIDGNQINLDDLQAKGPWCAFGEDLERTFIKKYGLKFNLDINPEKSTNKFAPDLLNTSNGKLADLKTQNTPFFLARDKYGYDPQYTVTFNKKDYERYLECYPSLEIYFWVSWIAVRFEGAQVVTVEPMEGIWQIGFKDLAELVQDAPLHPYKQRYGDTKGNARDSYLLSLKQNGFDQIG